ncbi:PREDICTED: mediator of RNA polymerase II [Prunus dulcis]|uniref:PREDICTED: mediator of RNA polymerase II n=1 Tax=Prunus dulcis TaxID=3755 RepID=A0A5E4EZ40_PRUDU|nr:mediator of RNA polymerase II transcription subunit 15a-like [Prunus dulcis]XP_034222250.1 mediator of RNA polymerase II transcription subunit 15a-like [Prunus dulcis]KAI5324781.1 hypothetical protein L3X38_033854 [Prunus dulcis]VVA21024.1 PREDICTED: mediator of RNA polymerase II [Prunus dulcis]
MDADSDWRTQFLPSSRQRIVVKIMDEIKRYPPFSGDGLDEIRRTAAKIEEKIYDVALSQTEYLRTISLKMIMIASRSESLGRMRPSNLKRRRILARDL